MLRMHGLETLHYCSSGSDRASLIRLRSGMFNRETTMQRKLGFMLWVVAVTMMGASSVVAQPTGSFGFNGSVSGFPTGAVSITGGGAYDLANGFVHSGGGFRCLEDVRQGPLSASINPDTPGPCL